MEDQTTVDIPAHVQCTTRPIHYTTDCQDHSDGYNKDMDTWDNSTRGEQSPGNVYLIETIVTSTSLVLIFVFAFVGNIVILTIIIKNPRMRTVVNAFVASLSTSDLLVPVFVMPMIFAVVVKVGWTPTETMCLLHNYVNSISKLCSTWTMAFIACDKYISVFSRSSWKITQIKANLIICTTWILAIVISIPWDVSDTFSAVKISNLERRNNLNTRYCYSFLNSTSTAETCRYVIVIVLCYVIPFSIMTCCYVVIAKNMKSTNQRIRPAVVASNQILFQAEMRTATTVLVMLSIYALCWLPYITVSIVSLFSHAPMSETVHNVTLWITWLNKAINPTIYAMRSRTMSRCMRIHNCGFRTNVDRRRDYLANNNTDRRVSFTTESCQHPTSSMALYPRSSIDSNLFLTTFSYDH